jgi:electron transfer flavoprotein-quinone oxidoreductase
LIPEGGYDALPDLATDGMLVAGDAAGLCLAAGLWLEGVNFAIGSGYAAGQAAADAIAAGDTTARRLASYRRSLESSFVLADHKRLRRAPKLLLSDRVQRQYPKLACDVAAGMFTVGNPAPKPGILALTRRAARRSGVSMRHLIGDALAAGRVFR